MSKGAPDWSNVRKGVSVFRLDDMAELAARLGSIVTYDRRGDVVLLDDYSKGLGRGVTNLDALGSTLTLSANQSRNSGYSAKATTVANAAALSGFSYRIAPLEPSKIGYEVSWSSALITANIRLAFRLYTGSQLLEFGIRYDSENDRLEYYDATGAWVIIASSLALNHSVELFHTLKLVVDTDTGKYARALLDESAYSLANISPQASASSVAPTMWLLYWLGNRVADIQTVYFCDVIMTQNEP